MAWNFNVIVNQLFDLECFEDYPFDRKPQFAIDTLSYIVLT